MQLDSKTVAFQTLGCKLNQYETDSLAQRFVDEGYTIVSFDSPAQVYVVNTCTVTNKSERKGRNILGREFLHRPGSLLVVTGCSVDNGLTLEKNDRVLYVPNADKNRIVSLVQQCLTPLIWQEEKPDVFGYTHRKPVLKTRGLVKIQDGCDNFCTYCIIPYVRGQAVSRSAESVLTEVKMLLASGTKEIVLTGINLGRYETPETSFSDLLQKILELPDDFRLRVTSVEPDGLDPLFFQLLKHPKMSPHLHLCLQSGSDNILKAMGRPYSWKDYCQNIEKIRTCVPDLHFTTDVIVGFPGETQQDFEATRNGIESLGFGHAHVFKYSRRSGTQADKMKNQIPERIKSQRSEELHQVSQEQTYKLYNSWLGKTQRVLLEKADGKLAYGFGQHYLPVQFPSPRKEKNQFVQVMLKGLQLQGEEFCFLGEEIL